MFCKTIISALAMFSLAQMSELPAYGGDLEVGAYVPVPGLVREFRFLGRIKQTLTTAINNGKISDAATFGFDQNVQFANRYEYANVAQGFDSWQTLSSGAKALQGSLRGPIRAGTTWKVKYQSKILTMKILNIGPLTTQAGIVENVVKVRCDGHLLTDGRNQPEFYYYAPGMGLVQMESVDVLHGATEPEILIELLGYRLPKSLNSKEGTPKQNGKTNEQEQSDTSINNSAGPKRGAVTVGGISVAGDQNTAPVITEVITKMLPGILYCYQKEQKNQPSLAGTVNVKFLITESGEVDKSELSSSTVANSETEQCTLRMVKRWKFPIRGPLSVSVPFVMRSK
jgi:TonB family protein